MPTRKRKPRFCTEEADSGCGAGASTDRKKKSTRSRKINRVLDGQNVIVDQDEQDRFVEFLERSVRQREVVLQLWARLPDNDIISLICAARDADDLDEAIWRSFLAAHFGRPSARPKKKNQVESASMLLCGFGATPKWTWNKVQKNWKSLRDWLYDHEDDLQSLSFGNHRKYDSQKPDLLWEVIESFIYLADEDDPFHTLYRRSSKLHRFGRTGRFDFLVMLLDLGLITAEPKSCYLRGATPCGQKSQPTRKVRLQADLKTRSGPLFGGLLRLLNSGAIRTVLPVRPPSAQSLGRSHGPGRGLTPS